MVAGPDDTTGGFHRDSPHVPEHHFPDDARTTRAHAGETMEDVRNWPGIVMCALGLVAVALTLTAAGYGYEGWAIVGGIAAAVLLLGGVGIIVLEHRRVKAARGHKLTDQQGH
ncbi:hypothetical protein GV794_13480 [Nocardia cyriacigeorgica]|uniref:UsfY protein n=1 Tax=Nocardia cyriacigeorgica TaxID=135487 RepID=A0A6P1D5W0_9NOCA|nr:hypothetical protein [Nocardia cyriacigeorgica]NEW37472.1 hypothetical protein [Nocardia cyriacigeorgica]NEW44949.1 hypothetical protein [Nocardia cyriacigeorgica]NEW49140.1 hypothetical protein [Nocardia cyriacigeorgica]NEW56658.1 hypothetical protein [Nocardia cyriacigeorgica]